MDITKKKITIIGAQRSGEALAHLIYRLDALPKISDQSSEDKISKDFIQWAKKNNIPLELSGHTQKFIEDSDMLVLSPGVRFDSPAVGWARKKDIPVLGEIEFAAQFCNKPIIAVTGSNGKTTTVNLINLVIAQSGKKPCLCGNVGLPFSSVILDLKDKDYVVLEVSSFQMESMIDIKSPFRKKFNLRGFTPYIGVILNFNQNHLDRHKDLDEYFEAKARMFLNQGKDGHAVLNYSNQRLQKLGSQLKSKVHFFQKSSNENGLKNPNHMAVTQVAQILGINLEVCKKVFNDFKGVEHRLELVRSLNGVDFINDSKATTAEAGEWALKLIDRPIVMICGGRDKNIDFSVIEELVRKKVKKMVVMGEAREKLKNTFREIVKVEEAQSFKEAIVKAKDIAAKGDCVLLSPMCASFDMFKNFEERGNVYKKIVNEL